MPLDSHRRLYLLLRLHVLASLLLPRSGSAAAVSAAGPVFKRNYQPQGAWGDFGEEASPFFLNGKMYHMQSVMGIMPEDGSEGTHSFFCIYDAATGAKVICPESSSKFAFCSAIVDHTVPADQRLWVFCSQWDRANKTYCPQPPPPPPPPAPRPGVFASAEQRAHSSTIGWGCGACSDAQRGVGDGCYVGAWSTSDLKTWSGPSKAVTLPLPFTVPNVAAAMIPPSSAGDLPPNLPKHQTFMAFEGGSFTALNIGTDRDLSKNWKLLPMVNRSSELCKNLSKEGKECATGLDCPTARYNPMDKYYYVFGGGNDIRITRSKDLVSWQQRPMSMATHCIAEDICVKFRPKCTDDTGDYQECCGVAPDCSPASGEGRIAPGFFTEYWAKMNATCKTMYGCRTAFLGNLSRWDWSVNDADFTDEGGKGPTRFIYCMCQQTKPKNATTGQGGGGYQLGTFPGNESEFLSSFWPSEA